MSSNKVISTFTFRTFVFVIVNISFASSDIAGGADFVTSYKIVTVVANFALLF